MRTMTIVMGCLNALSLLMMSTFIVATLIRKTKHIPFIWFNMILLVTIQFIIAVAQLTLSEKIGEYCNYSLQVIYGFCTIALFYQALSIAYRNNYLLYDILHFSKHGRLQSQSTLKWRFRGMLSCTILVAIILVLFAALGFGWALQD